MAKHVGAAHTAPLGLIGAEHGTQIAEPGCAQQRVTQRMSGDVTVGMTGAAVGVFKVEAEQPARPPCLNRMYVGPETDAQVRHTKTS